jgi:hypothetical protein
MNGKLELDWARALRYPFLLWFLVYLLFSVSRKDERDWRYDKLSAEKRRSSGEGKISNVDLVFEGLQSISAVVAVTCLGFLARDPTVDVKPWVFAVANGAVLVICLFSWAVYGYEEDHGKPTGRFHLGPFMKTLNWLRLCGFLVAACGVAVALCLSREALAPLRIPLLWILHAAEWWVVVQFARMTVAEAAERAPGPGAVPATDPDARN